MEKKFMWYIIGVFAGSEKKIVENIERVIKNNKLKNSVSQIFIPVQKIKEKNHRNNKEKEKEKLIYPGYIFINMVHDDNIFRMIRYVNGVQSIGGSKNGSGDIPQPITQEEIDSVFKRTGVVKKEMFLKYKVGDFVVVTDGKLKGVRGKIISLEPDKKSCKIETFFFGRKVITSVDFSLIEKDMENNKK